MISGQGGRAQSQPQSALPATIPGYLASRPLQSASPQSSPTPVTARSAAVSRGAQGRLGRLGFAVHR